MKLFKRLREKPPEGDHVLAVADEIDRVSDEMQKDVDEGRKFANEIRGYSVDKRKTIVVLATVRSIPTDPIDAILEMVVQAV